MRGSVVIINSICYVPRMKWSFFFIVAYCINLIGADNPIYLLTESRTGTHWSSYIIQAFTTKPLYSLYGNKLWDIRYPLEVDDELEPIHHAHLVKKIPKDIKKKNALLFVTLRDYHEVVLRGPMAEKHKKLTSGMRHLLDRYASILRYYDNYSSSSRYLIQYENLVTKPNQEIAAIFQFLQDHKVHKSEGALEEFLDHYEEHRNWMVNAYDGKRGSYSKGKKVQLYKSKASPELIKTMRKYLKKTHPLIWNKYFSRYR